MSPREHRASLRRDLQEGSYCAQFKTYHDEMKENEDTPPNHNRLPRPLASGAGEPVTEAPTPRTDAAYAERLLWASQRPDVEPQDDLEGKLLEHAIAAPPSMLATARTFERELAAARAAIKVAREKLADAYAKGRKAQIPCAYFLLDEMAAALAQLNTHTHE